MIYLKLFLTFFKIGAFTFGGGYAMLSLIQREVVESGWISSQLFTDIVAISQMTPGPIGINSATYFIAVSESTPGPFAINIATYVGNVVGGVFGSVCATLGVVMPSFIIVLIVARIFEKFKTSKFVSGIMCGLKPAVIGLIGSALISMVITVFFHDSFDFDSLVLSDLLLSLGIAALMTVLAFKKVHPIIIILLSAGIGIAGGYLL